MLAKMLLEDRINFILSPNGIEMITNGNHVLYMCMVIFAVMKELCPLKQ